ncbi:hypothetical protein JQ633_12390 [Bradyrhizobium tropiciagri]|uniref:hypothetical protein n=1 Tax=Bradyrhizobium tropiciagri TaxID=312253 RepID=UPI001BAC51D2|nr:hypothetical protein [Bradyrhizobium tropiciagri]MBR0871162.1 hypothetical protein [Bradyrhizobium tropiciagri]
MSLSDACADFVIKMRAAESEAARQTAVVGLLASTASCLRSPIAYGDELLMVAAGCREYLFASKSNADPVQRIIFVADSVREFLDRPPYVEARAS